MKLIKSSIGIITIVLGLTGISPAWAKKSLPEVNDEGMVLVENSKLAVVYADPGADLGIYNRIWLMDAAVAFKKNWQRDQNRTSTFKVKTRDMENIKERVATLFREVFTQQLLEGGYELVEEAGEDVLVVRPAIVDLDVVAPDIRSSTASSSYSQSAGEMTLRLELLDSETGDKIVEATDRKQDYWRGYMELRTRVSNYQDARNMMLPWAKALVEALDEARVLTSTPE